MDEALAELRADVGACEAFEGNLRGKELSTEPKSRGSKVLSKTPSKAPSKDVAATRRLLSDRVETTLTQCLDACKESRKRHREEAGPGEALDDLSLSQLTRFTDQIALEPYKQFLHYVPRLVNVVTLAEALPMPGSGITLPLDLSRIAASCKGSFYAPRRFAAVQLAYSEPRCRVLIFHTGRLVGTGTGGAAAARLAIARAQRQLAEDAQVYLHVRNFAVINEVGAVSLRATLNCDAFATEHSGESHFDRSSFVGLAWRPPREHICCEIYSTGKANLPGSVVERQLLESFSRMLPELLRFSSKSYLLNLIPESMQAHHRTCKNAASSSAAEPTQRQFVVANKARQRLGAAIAPAPKKEAGLWDGWEDADQTATVLYNDGGEDDDGEIDLAELGL